MEYFRKREVVKNIKQKIESKICCAFGLKELRNKKDGSSVPFNMSTVFEILKENCSNISFSVSLTDIIRIYYWTTFYLEHEIEGNVWNIEKARTYLRKFINLKRTKNEKVINYGISLHRNTITKIQEKLKERIKEEKGDYYEIITCEAEALVYGNQGFETKHDN